MIFQTLSENLIFECTNPYSCGWWIKNDTFEWLTQNVGHGSQAGGWVENQDWIWVYRFLDGKPRGNTIGFMDVTKATMFKLTWGGA